MGFFSFVVWSPGEVPLKEANVVLERGQNVFNAALTDPQLLAIRKKMLSEGVRLIRQNRLTQEPLSVSDIAWTQDDHQFGLQESEPGLLVANSEANAGSPEESTEAGTAGGSVPVDRDESSGHRDPPG